MSAATATASAVNKTWIFQMKNYSTTAGNTRGSLAAGQTKYLQNRWSVIMQRNHKKKYQTSILNNIREIGVFIFLCLCLL